MSLASRAWFYSKEATNGVRGNPGEYVSCIQSYTLTYFCITAVGALCPIPHSRQPSMMLLPTLLGVI